MKVQPKKVKIETLSLDPHNPRSITKEKFEELKQSIKDFPEMESVKPLTIADGFVIGGNMRLLAMKDLGYREVLVNDVTEWTQAQRDEFMIKDNTHYGAWDYDILANEWDVHPLNDWGLDLWEAEPEEMKGLTDENEVPDAPQDPITKLGDVWILGEHRVMCGDSTSKEAVDILMDGEASELLFTSPPYSDMREYNGGKDLSIGNLINFIPTFSNYANYQVINLGIQRKNNEIVQYWDDYISKAKETGYKLLSWNIWNRENAGFSVANITAMFAIQHEWLFVFGKERKGINLTIQNKEGGKQRKETANRQKDGSIKKSKSPQIRHKRQLGTVNTINPQLARSEVKHPAMFPVELPEEYIKAMTQENDVISDPFLGSGTTLIAAEKTKRKCYGMELDPKYCDVIVKRWEDFTGKKAAKI